MKKCRTGQTAGSSHGHRIRHEKVIGLYWPEKSLDSASTNLRRELEKAKRRLAETEGVAKMWNEGSWEAAVWEARNQLHQSHGNLLYGYFHHPDLDG